MGYSLVNILGGLLIVTSTMVVVSKTIPSAIKWYAIQSVVLVGVLLTLGLTTGATELLMWAASAFVTKVISFRSFSTVPTRRWVRLPIAR